MLKKILSVLFISLLIVTSVQAMESKTFTGTAKSSTPYLVDFVTHRQGDVTIRVTWTPKRNVNYVFQAFHYTNPEYPYNSRDIYNECFISTYNYGTPPAGNWLCTIPNAPAGYYRAYFRPYNGPEVRVTYEITAETNP